MVQAGRPALCASPETAGHEAHHSKTELIDCVCVCETWPLAKMVLITVWQL